MDDNSTKRFCPKCGAEIPADSPQGLCPKCVLAKVAEPTDTGSGGQAAPFAAPPLEAVQAAFPQFEILECIGQGGMGIVYKARQKSLNRIVALKLLPPERVKDPRFSERFAREAQSLAAMNHPNIVSIHDFGQAGDFYYLLMEYVDGVNLRQAMRAGRFTPEQALAIVPPVCEALQFAHNRGIVHRDIKPENLLLDKDGRVKIADFGIAKMLGTERGSASRGTAGVTKTSQSFEASGLASNAAGHSPALHSAATLHTAAGTPQYMAPEQQTDPRKTDHRADIYSLGVVLYEMLTGELPGKRIEAPSRKVHIDVRLDEIVLRALEVKPELRFATAAEFRTQVEELASQAGGSGRASAQPASESSTTIASPLPPEPAAPGKGAVTLATVITLFYSVAAAFTLVSLMRPGVPEMLILLAIGFGAAWAGRRRLQAVIDTPARRRRALSWVAFVLALPLLGLGLFIVASLAGESGGWNPATAETMFVPLTWLGALLLPWAGLVLRMATRKPGAALPFRPTPAGSAGFVLGLVLLVGGLSLPALFFVNQSRANAARGQAHFRQVTSTQKAWTDAIQKRFEAQVALNRWQADTSLLRDSADIAARQAEEARLRAALNEAEAAVQQFDRSLEELNRRSEREALASRYSVRRILPGSLALLGTGAVLFWWSRRGRPAHQHVREDSNPWARRIFWLLAMTLGAPLLLFGGLILAVQAARAGISGIAATGFITAALALVLGVFALAWMFGRSLRRHPTDIARPWPRRLVMLAGAFVVVPAAFMLTWMSVYRVARAPAPTASAIAGPEIVRVDVTTDQAVIHSRGSDDAGMLILFGTEGDRWKPKSRDLEAMFDVTMEKGWFEQGVRWIIKTRRGTRWSYHLDRPGGTTTGKVVFHPGTPISEADGAYAIGEFRPESGAPLPITVRIERYSSPQTIPETNHGGPETTGSIRLRFAPQEGMANKTSWSVWDKPSHLNPDGWAFMTRMTLGGTAWLWFPGEKERTANITLVSGDDDAITIRIEDLKRNSKMVLTLPRNKPGEITVDGAGYRVLYMEVEVAADQEDTSPFAHVLVTPAGGPQTGENEKPPPGRASATETKPSLVSSDIVEQARRNFATAKVSFDAGRISQLQLIEAETHLKRMEALLAGDQVEAARAKLNGARELLKLAELLRSAGRITGYDFAEKERAVAEAEAELQRASADETAPGKPGTNRVEAGDDILMQGYEEFDQRPGRGWRAYADKGRHSEAALLIERYLAGQGGLADWQKVNLHFHAAQCHALSGEPAGVEKALAHLAQARHEPEIPNSPVRWNDYVDATEAFLRNDLKALKAARERIAAGPKSDGNAANLMVVDRLISNFGKPYSEAYSNIKRPGSSAR